jgi:hypothetical protein
MTEKTIVPNLTKDETRLIYKRKIILLVFGFMIMYAGMIVLFAKLYLHNNNLERLLTVEETKSSKLKIEIADLKGVLETSKQISSIALAEVAVMKTRMSNLKNGDDLMIRDIELYILTRFRRVPKVVARTLATSIVAACKEQDVSPEVVMGIIEIESQFNPMARNEKSGAIGAMQVMPEWHKKLGLKSVYDLYDIPVNINSGVKILKIHTDEDAKGNLEQGLYFYVGKDSTYAARVFQAAGKFTIFRYGIEDQKEKVEVSEKESSTEDDKSKPNESNPKKEK